jgi:hypothetical protein
MERERRGGSAAGHSQCEFPTVFKEQFLGYSRIFPLYFFENEQRSNKEEAGLGLLETVQGLVELDPPTGTANFKLF